MTHGVSDPHLHLNLNLMIRSGSQNGRVPEKPKQGATYATWCNPSSEETFRKQASNDGVGAQLKRKERGEGETKEEQQAGCQGECADFRAKSTHGSHNMQLTELMQNTQTYQTPQACHNETLEDSENNGPDKYPHHLHCSNRCISY
jgi:hypothetical protein